MTEHGIVEKLKEQLAAAERSMERQRRSDTCHETHMGYTDGTINAFKIAIDIAESALPATVAPAQLSDAEVQEIEDCYPKDAPAPAAEAEDDELANVVNRAWAKDVKELETRLAHYEELLPIAKRMRSRLKHEPHGPFYSEDNCDCGLNSLLADFTAWQAKEKGGEHGSGRVDS